MSYSLGRKKVEVDFLEVHAQEAPHSARRKAQRDNSVAAPEVQEIFALDVNAVTGKKVNDLRWRLNEMVCPPIVLMGEPTCR